MSTNHSRIWKLNAIESQPNRVQMRMKRQVPEEVLSTAVDLTQK